MLGLVGQSSLRRLGSSRLNALCCRVRYASNDAASGMSSLSAAASPLGLTPSLSTTQDIRARLMTELKGAMKVRHNLYAHPLRSKWARNVLIARMLGKGHGQVYHDPRESHPFPVFYSLPITMNPRTQVCTV